MTLLPWGWTAKGFLAGTRHRWRRGYWPADAFRNSWPLLALDIPGSRYQALASGDGGVDGDETPRVSTSHTGMAILNLPVPLGSQPGTFGGPLLALYPLCSRCLPDANTSRSCRLGRECPQKTASVRYCPPQTIWPKKCDPSHMTKGRQDSPAVPNASRPGETGNSGCHTSPASWIAWDEQSADQAREPSRCGQSGGKRRQRNRRAKRRWLPRRLPPKCWSRSSAPGLHSEGQKRHSRSWSTRLLAWASDGQRSPPGWV
jgi:hypothetical protein